MSIDFLDETIEFINGVYVKLREFEIYPFIIVHQDQVLHANTKFFDTFNIVESKLKVLRLSDIIDTKHYDDLGSNGNEIIELKIPMDQTHFHTQIHYQEKISQKKKVQIIYFTHPRFTLFGSSEDHIDPMEHRRAQFNQSVISVFNNLDADSTLDDIFNNSFKNLIHLIPVDRVCFCEIHSETLVSRRYEYVKYPYMKKALDLQVNISKEPYVWLVEQLDKNKYVYIESVDKLSGEASGLKRELLRLDNNAAAFFRLSSRDGFIGLEFMQTNYQMSKRDINLMLSFCYLINMYFDIIDLHQMIRAEEVKFKALIDYSPISIGFHQEGIITYVNQAAVQTFNATSADDLVGTPVLDRVHPDYKQFVIDRLRKISLGTSEQTFVYEKMLTLDEKVLDVLVAATTFKIGPKETNLVLVNDISDQKALEQALSESEQKYKNLTNLLPHTLIVISAEGDKSRVEYINSKGLQLLGYAEPEELLGREVMDFIHEENRDYVSNWFSISSKKFDKPKFGKILRKDGKSVPVEVSIGPTIFSNKDAYIALIQDITPRIRNEEEIERTVAKFKSIFYDSTDALYVSMEDGDLIEYNEVFARIFRLPKDLDEIINTKQFYQDIGERVALVEELDAKGFVKDYRVNLKKYTGEPMVCLISSRAIVTDQSENFQYQGMIVDITQKEKAEKNLLRAQKLESLGVLAKGIAHDFNNVLMGIMGSMNIMSKMVEPDSKMVPLIDMVNKSSMKARDLVKELMEYSGKGYYVKEKINLSQLLDSIYPLITSIVKTHPLIIHLNDKKSIVNIASNQTGQVILNLVSNSADAMEHHKGSILIEVNQIKLTAEDIKKMVYHDESTNEGVYSYIRVTDDGPGIDPEDLDFIFDPFYSTKSEGRGLGLAATLGIMKSHEGLIKIETEAGKGTSFYVYFPIHSPGEKEITTRYIGK